MPRQPHQPTRGLPLAPRRCPKEGVPGSVYPVARVPVTVLTQHSVTVTLPDSLRSYQHDIHNHDLITDWTPVLALAAWGWELTGLCPRQPI